MNKLLLAISATFLLNSTMAQAAVETFNFTFSGESYSNTATSTGYLTIDTALGAGPTASYYDTDFNNIIDAEMTITGSTSSDGFYNLSSFSQIIFSFSPLDLSLELVGQESQDGSIFGQGQYGQLDKGLMFWWNTFGNTTQTLDGYTLVTDVGTNNNSMKLTSFAPASVAAVPEADTSAMLLTGLGVVGLMARRRKNTQA